MNKSEQKISIVYESPDCLKEYPGNPRNWDRKSKEDLKKSFIKHGIVIPFLVNEAKGRENIVLSGNLRLVVAREMKLKEVPIVKIKIDDPKIEQDIVLRANINNGYWDTEILKNWDLDIVIEAGFKDFELSPIFDDLLETSEDEWDIEKEKAKIIEPKTNPGEIFQLGEHTLGCGSATDREFLKKVMGGKKVEMVYCDPPYNISLNYNKGLGGKSSYGGKTQDNLSDSDYKAFIKSTIDNALSVAKASCHLFYYSDQKYIGMIQQVYKELGVENKRVCLWIKNGLNPTPGLAFNKCYEPCTYGIIGKPYVSPKCPNLTEILNKEVATGNRQIDDILDMLDIWLVKRLAGQDYSHPTQKPITLHEKALRRCTRVNDTVLDLFAGSGSTLISCEQLKRRCITIDVDPVFCDLVIKRFEANTGQKAKLISKGDQNE